MLVKNLIVLIIAYLLGSISTSIIVSKIMIGDDIRNHGSGNAGATNVLRTYGKGAAAIVFLLDILKGVIAVMITRIFFDDMLYDCASALGAVLGHNFPLYYGFKGGKGVATSLAVLLSLHYPAALIAMATFMIVVLTTKYVSLSSILAALAAGKYKLNDIYAQTGFSRAKISVYIKNLIELDVVEKVFSFDALESRGYRKGSVACFAFCHG